MPHTMLDLFRESLRKYFVQTILVIVLIPAGVFSASSVLFPFSREIVYDMHTVFSTCHAIRAGQCVARMELIIGNTGHTDETVNLVWPRFEGPWSQYHNVLDISADRPRGGDPVVRCSVAEGRQECSIEQFAAGALVIMQLDCYRCSKREVEMLGDTPLEIQTGAHASYGDPRVTLLFRRLLALARLFM
ncbi:MAG: hypothetical protein HYY48_12340 [Gammaproteobacteria bacterium]|nr:hypothetical protein [Gammaproteobacteria bacterium]